MSRNENPAVETTKLLDINIHAQDGSVDILRVPSGMTMKRIFKIYCRDKQITDYKTYRFLFEGKRISSTMTVDEVGIKDGDQIDAMLFQYGGGSAN